MDRKRALKICLEALSFCLYLLAGQFTARGSENLSFSAIFPRNEYFADRMIVDLLHDSRGYLWIGTYDGLLRYDGTSFRYFTRGELHTESSVICSLLEDSRGNVWIGTEGGLCRYCIETGTFAAVDTKGQDEERIDTKVGCIREDRSGSIWFTLKSKGIWSYNPQTSEFRNFLNDTTTSDGRQASTHKINTFVIDNAGSFIISEYCNGLYIAKDDFSSFEPLDIQGFNFGSDNIPCLIADERNCIYAGSTTYGLCEIFPYSTKASVIVPLEDGVQPTGLSMDCEPRTLYMSTSKGLYSTSLTGGKSTLYDCSNTFGLPSDNLCGLCVDKDGAILVGLSSGNLYYCSLKDSFIQKYASLNNGESLKGAQVRHFAEDADGNILILTESKGLLRLGRKKAILEKLTFTGVPDHCEDISVVGNSLYVSSGSCLYCVGMDSGRVKKFTPESLGAEWLIDRPIYPIFHSDGLLYLGTALGVVSLDPASGTCGRLPGLEECNVNGLCRKGDTLFVSTYAHGLVKYSLSDRRTIRFHNSDRLLKLTGRRLNGVWCDSFGRIWVATGESGVVIVEEGGEIRHLDTGNTFGALMSDNIRSLKIDYGGSVWAATENGMTYISSDLGTFEHYSEADGLLNNSFMSRSSFTASDGTLYFGSRDGFISFQPDKAHKTRRKTPELYVDELRVNNELITPETSRELSRNIELTERIKLSHKRNSLSFTFSRPALPSSSDGYIVCRMKGLDREWVRLGPDNVFSCREMPSGKYELLARSYSIGGEMEAEHSPIEIQICPPFYRSIAAIVFYVLAAAGVLSAGGIYLWKKLKKEEEERYRRFTEEKLALTPERKMLRAAQIGQSPSAYLNPELSESEWKFISKLDEVIEKNISDEKLNYGLVAEQLCIGKQSLNIKVKSILGVTVSNYILLYRLFVSVPLLSEDDSRVNVVCFKVGFNTPSYFAKCFKNAFGMLPGEFKDC